MSTWYYWLFLAGSILFEVGGTSVMKLSQTGLMSEVSGMLLMYLMLGISYYCLAKAVVKLPLGVAYAFWEGFGLLLITLVSTFLLHERLDGVRLIALGLVFGGVLLVHHGTDSHEAGPSGKPAVKGKKDTPKGKSGKGEDACASKAVMGGVS